MGLQKSSDDDAARLVERGDEMARKALRKVRPHIRDIYLLMANRLYALATGR